jgi:hypothetical protein
MSDAAPKSGFFVTAAAVLGGFLVFVLILAIAYLPNKPAPVTPGTKTPEERAAILRELVAKEVAAATTYGWVDQGKGIVRIPIDRAVQLTIDDLNQQSK